MKKVVELPNIPEPSHKTDLLKEQEERLSMNSFDYIDRARQDAVQWAREVLNHLDQVVILDTETTGLDSQAQIVQLAMIDGFGNVLVDNQLFRPTVEIDREAEEVHGFSGESLGAYQTFDTFAETFSKLLEGRRLIVYNAAFDVRILYQTLRAFGIEQAPPSLDVAQCAMKQYAKFVGDWDRQRGSFRWHRLPAGSHDALGDCRAVLELIKIMAQAGE